MWEISQPFQLQIQFTTCLPYIRQPFICEQNMLMECPVWNSICRISYGYHEQPEWTALWRFHLSPWILRCKGGVKKDETDRQTDRQLSNQTALQSGLGSLQNFHVQAHSKPIKSDLWGGNHPLNTFLMLSRCFQCRANTVNQWIRRESLPGSKNLKIKTMQRQRGKKPQKVGNTS